jgi:hypothetical protein
MDDSIIKTGDRNLKSPTPIVYRASHNPIQALLMK